ncbi:MAG TPA: alpha/beta fold hydrolase [Steroidobacteraceae bacterium]|nr:alpha/beta fold hydrolase [Steroidobacteraceae bacterium]
MPRTILTVFAVAALIYIALCVVLFLAQRAFIYYPQPKSATNNGTTLTLNIDEARVLVSTRPHLGPDAVIYFGGNAEDVSRSLQTLVDAFPERAVFALNYRGYGGSTGRPSESALIADALVLFDRVHTEHPHIVVIGRSLGSGVAVRLASERAVERLVLVTPYDSLLNLAAGQFRYFPIRWLLLDKFESWRYAAKVSAPTQLIAAQNDEVIPAASTEALYEHMPESLATLTVIRGVGHNDISESPEYIQALRGPP